MSHRNAPLSFEGRLRLVQRCQQRPISHVAAEMGISRACASKWVNRWHRHGELGLHDRPSTPHHSPDATPAWVIERIETWRREKKWPANRITHELAELDFRINRRTVTDNGACYRSNDFARIVGQRTRHQKTKPYTPRHNGKAERYQRIMTGELLYAREYASEDERSQAIAIWNVHYNYHRPHSAAGGQPPASRLKTRVTNVRPSYT